MRKIGMRAGALALRVGVVLAMLGLVAWGLLAISESGQASSLATVVGFTDEFELEEDDDDDEHRRDGEGRPRPPRGDDHDDDDDDDDDYGDGDDDDDDDERGGERNATSGGLFSQVDLADGGGDAAGYLAVIAAFVVVLAVAPSRLRIIRKQRAKRKSVAGKSATG